MLKLSRSSRFKKDLKKAMRQRKNFDELKKVITLLQRKKKLPKKYCDHSLEGNWLSYRECHISPDWLLIYKINDKLNLLLLARIGSHSDLFK